MIRLRSIFKQSTKQYIRFNSTKEQPRINPVGIQYLSSKLDRAVFPSKITKEQTEDEKALIELSKTYLSTHGLLGKKTNISDPISFDIPELQGSDLDEHFRRIALFASETYLQKAKGLANIKLPKPPKKWLKRSGWIRYEHGEIPIPVDFPEEDALVFDVETLYKISKYPVLATAVSSKAWYCWVSPIITEESSSFDHLIPMNTLESEKVIVGHNVGYDRARIKEEYDLRETKAFYLDTMSLHVAVSGMCSQQRSRWLKHDKLKKNSTSEADDINQSEMDDPWISYSSLNSLAAVADFYFGKKVDKDIRESFSSENIQVIKDDFHNLVNYCANDVMVTHEVYSHVLDEFLNVCPHPVSFAALKFMGSGILPTNKSWYKYIENAESLYQKMRLDVDRKLVELAKEAVKLKDSPDKFLNDPWLNQLDWEIKPVRIKKNGELYKNQKLPGYPNWYKDLWNSKEQKLNITTRSRVTPLLLKLQYEGCPVVWDDLNGWCFKANVLDFEKFKQKNYIYEQNFGLTAEEIEIKKSSPFPDYRFFRVPNKQGPEYKTTLLLAKSFSSSFDKGILKSDSPFAQEALEMNSSCSYWISSRERIMSQFVVDKSDDYGIILPQIVTMGTITRRAVEKTWLTASNAKKTRIGSELKSKVIAPPGYCFVGADVDSEELWIASLVGDAIFKMHGGTSIGWMTLEGTKSEGTDLHSKTAKILGISRNEAKIFNYGRIYGAGVKFATTLLKQFNPELSDSECSERAKNLYAETKGQTGRVYVDKKQKKIWFGGSESVLFNELERVANQETPKTPILGAGITKALLKRNLNMNSFLPSRVNWAIQSSGVDYLHLLCVSMNYLMKIFRINGRLSISVHDEIRYLCEEKDKYKVAMCLQISNIWTRAIFSENLGIKELPQSCAFFSAIDIDHILRKEVDMDCITPSNSIAVKPGESLDIVELLKIEDAKLGNPNEISLPELSNPKILDDQKTTNSEENFKFSYDNMDWKKTIVEMQITQSAKKFKSIFHDYKKQHGRLDFKNVISGELVLSDKAIKKVRRNKPPEGKTVTLSAEENITNYVNDKLVEFEIGNIESKEIFNDFKEMSMKGHKINQRSLQSHQSNKRRRRMNKKDIHLKISGQETSQEFHSIDIPIEEINQIYDINNYTLVQPGYNPSAVDIFFSENQAQDQSEGKKAIRN